MTIPSVPFLVALLTAVASTLAAQSPRGGDLPLVPPNIVVVVTDDMRPDQLQVMPFTRTLLAPPLGFAFTNAFANTPLCCPARATLLTGQYSHRHGVLNNDPPDGGAAAFEDSTSLAVWLRRAGYRTALLGKYLNGFEDFPEGYVPPGWDVFFHTRDYLIDGEHQSDVLTREAVSFVESTPLLQPVFLYLAPFAPHAPAIPHPSDAGSFAGSLALRTPNFNEADVSDKPAWVRRLPLLKPGQVQDIDQLYARQLETLQGVDRMVQDVTSALIRSGRIANTVFVFTSDNGLSHGSHRWRVKECPYEECVRVPLLMTVPAMIGREVDQLVGHVDLAPTLSELAGASPTLPMDGRSLLPILRGTPAEWRSEILLEALAAGNKSFSAARSARYKYTEYEETGERELYDLATDPFELENRAGVAAYRTVRDELRRALDRLRGSP